MARGALAADVTKVLTTWVKKVSHFLIATEGRLNYV